MAYEDSSTYDPQVTSALWNQYYGNVTTPDAIPSGFQFNQNQMIADALRGYDQNPYFTEATYMPGYENTLTRKLIEKNAAGTTTPTQTRSQSSMPNMNMMQGMMGGSGFAPSSAAATPGTGLMDFSAPFGSTGGTMVNAGASSVPMGAGDFAGSGAASSSGGGLMDFGSSFGSTGSSMVSPGTAASGAGENAAVTAAGAEGSIPILGTIGGATAGYLAGRDNYESDPNMRNGKDGFGKHHRDWRAEVGGGTLGGVMGMFGYGAAAYPAVRAAHYVMEPVTRQGINLGDKIGGAGGAMMIDPIGTASSGKYSWGDIGKGALLGPAFNLFK